VIDHAEALVMAEELVALIERDVAEATDPTERDVLDAAARIAATARSPGRTRGRSRPGGGFASSGWIIC
jgi:hypothetical protein